MIEKMKFLSITGPKADIDRLTKTYLSRYEIHLESALAELTDVANLSPFLEINPYREALTIIDSFYEQLDESERATSEQMDVETALATVDRIQKHANILEEQKQKLQEEHAGMVESLKIIRPFKDLDYDISTILNFKYIHYRFGRIEKQYLQKFEKYIYDNLDTLFIKCGEDDQYVYGVYFVPEHEAHKVHAVYSSMHFERIFVPDEYQGTARQAFEKLDKRHRDIHAGLDANKAEYQHFLTSYADKIVSAKAALEACSRNFDIRKLAACTQGEANTFYILCGWMTEKDALAFQKDIQDDDKIFCLMEDQQAPAKKNRRPSFETRNFLNHLKCMSRCTVFRLTTKWTRPGLWRSLTPLSSEPCSEMSDRDWSCSSADCSSTKPKDGSRRHHRLCRCFLRFLRFYVRKLLWIRRCSQGTVAQTYECHDGCAACRTSECRIRDCDRFRNVYHSDLYGI